MMSKHHHKKFIIEEKVLFTQNDDDSDDEGEQTGTFSASWTYIAIIIIIIGYKTQH